MTQRAKGLWKGKPRNQQPGYKKDCMGPPGCPGNTEANRTSERRERIMPSLRSLLTACTRASDTIRALSCFFKIIPHHQNTPFHSKVY